MEAAPNLTERTRGVCRRLVERLGPAESELFDPLWATVWRSLPADRIEELTSPVLTVRSGQMGPALAAIGGSNELLMESLCIVASVLGAVVDLLQRKSHPEIIDTAAIDVALRREAGRFRASPQVLELLASTGVALLAEHLGASDWLEPQRRPRQDDPPLWVEWREPDGEGRPSCAANSRDQVDAQFVSRAAEFLVYVNETEDLVILVDGDQIDLPASHRRLLYLVLEGARHSGIVPYDKIRNFAMQDEMAEEKRVRHFKSAASTKTGGLINEVLKAKWGTRQYEIQMFSYCWIRYRSSESRLSA